MALRAPFCEVIHSLIDFVFPPACLICGKTFSEGNLICPDCKNTLTVSSFCYEPPPRYIKSIRKSSVLLPYDTLCRTLIHALKYHSMPSLGLFLGELMGKKIIHSFSLPENTILVPIPLHLSRYRERGYNQSERLAQGFASFTGHSIDVNIITRIRNTGTQTALNPLQRAHNVQNAFRYTGKQSLLGCHVILIDDVMTTGSTLSECAQILFENGASTIFASVAATPEIGED